MVNDSMNLLGDYLPRKAPSTLVKRANSMVFFHTTLQQLGFSGLLVSLTCTGSLRRCIHLVTALAV